MILVVGVVLLAATVLLFAWGFAQHRRVIPARWTRYTPLSSGFVIINVAMLPGALGALAAAASKPEEVRATLGLPGIAAIVASIIVAVALTPRFIRQGRSGTADIVHFPLRPGGASTGKVKKAA